MKGIKRIVIIFFLLFSLTLPLTVLAVGEGNIATGGSGFGKGTAMNKWRNSDEGVRVTVVDAVSGDVVSGSFDLTNVQPDDIELHFGKVCKSQYRSGISLSPNTGVYQYINPVQSLPKIISTSSGPGKLEAIKRFFTDEQVIRSIAGYAGISFETLINGSYKILLEPVAYVTYQGMRIAFTATEAAIYDQLIGGKMRQKIPSLSHKNLPLAMFLETADLGYPAWGGSRTEKVTDTEIISSLGLGIVRFNDVVIPMEIEADYEYRVNTDVISSVTVSGGQSDPDHPVSVSFLILGQEYTVENVYYPEDGQQLVWVKWHTPDTEQVVTIEVAVSGGGEPEQGIITANIVDLDKNPPPNPIADDRNDLYDISEAVLPDNQQKTSASWSVWRPEWNENWIWHSDWQWVKGEHEADCPTDCDMEHEVWRDQGTYVDEGWWEFYLDHYYASLTADMQLRTDTLSPTATENVIKSGYGVNIIVNASASSSQMSATTPPQNAVSYFPEFYYERYWRLLERMENGYHTTFAFQENHYSTYNRRTHFTPIWMPDGEYKVYTWLIDCWTPDGMLSMNLTDSVQIEGDLWEDWHIAPQNVR